MGIDHWVVINKRGLYRDNILLNADSPLSPEQVYSDLKCNYPKFYKMDKLCKWAFVATECLLADSSSTLAAADMSKIAVVLSTSHGCIDVDKRYAESAIPSPALFVYTLPNIMLGEICIRHGFKGEQLCMANKRFDARELYFAADVLLKSKDIDACLCGWADVNADDQDICLFWITKQGGTSFQPAMLEELYKYSK